AQAIKPGCRPTRFRLGRGDRNRTISMAGVKGARYGMTAERPNWSIRKWRIPGEGARLNWDSRLLRSGSVPRIARVPTAAAATTIMASLTVNRLGISPAMSGPPQANAIDQRPAERVRWIAMLGAGSIDLVVRAQGEQKD